MIYYLICLSHGDFAPAHLDQSDWLPCISETDGFASIFLFSLETQQTIGYGTRQTTTNCPQAILVMSLQVTSDNCIHWDLKIFQTCLTAIIIIIFF